MTERSRIICGDVLTAPFPYFGGKRSIAPLVWRALGEPKHYIEPFFGSGAVLLARPDYVQGKHIETVCDKDGLLANVWRALQFEPDAVAKWCDWPVNHKDLNDRRKFLLENKASLMSEMTSDVSYDTKMAGYWVYCASCWIGSGLTCPNAIPNIGNGGQGVHGLGQIPHLRDGGKGVHKLGKRPHINTGGKGVHKTGQIPHLSDGGMGVYNLSIRPERDESLDVRDPYNMNIYAWFRQLSERLRYIRVVCGDWGRVCGGDWQDNMGPVGIFFDPPYSDVAGRDPDLYAEESQSVAHDVREWCLARGDRPSYRIVLAGYYEEHESLLAHGWTVKRWKTQGGYGGLGKGKGMENRHREALFMSPHCLTGRKSHPLFAGLETTG